MPGHLRLDTLALASLLRDDAPAESLPDTGLPWHFERLLSAIFVQSPEYGTRCTTIAVLGKTGGGALCELTHNPKGQVIGQVTLDWQINGLLSEGSVPYSQ